MSAWDRRVALDEPGYRSTEQCEDTSVRQKRGQPRGSRCQRRAVWRVDGVNLCTQHAKMD